MHAFFEMDVFQMNRLLEFVGIVEGNDFIVDILQVTFAIVFEDSAEDPAVTVEVCELGVLKLLVEFRGSSLFEKGGIRPQSSNRRGLGIPRLCSALLVRVWMTLLRRPHMFAIHFVIPTSIGRNK